MTRTITITTERIRRVIVRYLRSPACPTAARYDIVSEESPEKTEPFGLRVTRTSSADQHNNQEEP